MTVLPIVALDTETTSLLPTVSRYGRRAWEFAALRRAPDGEFDVLLAHVEPDRARMQHADPVALDIGGYDRAPWRHPMGCEGGDGLERRRLDARFGRGGVWSYHVAARDDHEARYRLGLALIKFLAGATIVGSNPGFDTENVSALLSDAGMPVSQLAPWHYKSYDIAQHGSAVLGLEGTGPSTAALSAQFGIARPVEHTALDDAAWALAMHDAIEAAKQDRR